MPNKTLILNTFLIAFILSYLIILYSKLFIERLILFMFVEFFKL